MGLLWNIIIYMLPESRIRNYSCYYLKNITQSTFKIIIIIILNIAFHPLEFVNVWRHLMNEIMAISEAL